MKDRAMKAAKRYLELQGLESLGECQDFLVCKNEHEDLVFVFVNYGLDRFPEINLENLRAEFETVVPQWLVENDMQPNFSIRCDEIDLHILGADKAFLRHAVNVLNA